MYGAPCRMIVGAQGGDLGRRRPGVIAWRPLSDDWGAPFLYFAQCAGFAVNNRLAGHRRQRGIVLSRNDRQSQYARGCRRGWGLIAAISAIVAGG